MGTVRVWLVALLVAFAGCTAPEPEPEPEVATCDDPCGVPDCTIETKDEGLVTSTLRTCIRTIVIEGPLGGVIEPAEDCDAGYDALNEKCYDACPEGWSYSTTAGSCVQDICGERPCVDPVENPGGYTITWTELSEQRCQRHPIAGGPVTPPDALGGDGYYEVCAYHNGTGELLVDTEPCGIPLAGTPGDNTTAQFCFAFSWQAGGGGVHLEGMTSFLGAHSDSHDPENPTKLDTPNGECAWESELVQGDYVEVDASDCLGWQPHKAWHYYPGKATGVHEGTSTTVATTPQGMELVVQARGQVFWAITP